MYPEIPPRKMSRFFSRGRNGIQPQMNATKSTDNDNDNDNDNVAPSLPRTVSETSTIEQGPSFGSITSPATTQPSSFASTTSPSKVKSEEDGKDHNGGEDESSVTPSNNVNNDDHNDNDEKQQISSDSPPPTPGHKVSSAISALENFSLNATADAPRRGIGQEEFEAIQKKELAARSIPRARIPSSLPPAPIRVRTSEHTSYLLPPTPIQSRPATQSSSYAARMPGALAARPKTPPGGWHNKGRREVHQFPAEVQDRLPRLAQPFQLGETDSEPSEGTSSLPPLSSPGLLQAAYNPDRGNTNDPEHATVRPATRRPRPQALYGYPRHLYTSPNRVPNAAAASRKRKRLGLVPPPPAYVYTRTNAPNFNVFNGILLYPELCFALAAQLTVEDLVSLYAISKDFHTILDTRFTTVILSQSLAKAPESSRVFPFRCYASLCRQDPAARIPHPDPLKAVAGVVRAVPSFRWLRMVLFREKVVHEIMAVMAEDGVPLPRRCGLALKRMWFIMDIPDNARRIGYVHAVNVVTDLDLYFAMVFFVKLDMRFCDPTAPRQPKRCMRRMVLNQGPLHRGCGGGLAFLLRVLKRAELQSAYDVIRMWVRINYEPQPDELATCTTIFGIPIAQAGKLRYEYWGRIPKDKQDRQMQFLLRPDQLVMREAVRRGIHFKRHFLRCLLYGYINPATMDNYPPRADLGRRIIGLEDEYGASDEIGGEQIPADKALRDPILDLGVRKTVSYRVDTQDKPQGLMERQQLQERKLREEEFLDKCMRWCENDREWEEVGDDADDVFMGGIL